MGENPPKRDRRMSLAANNLSTGQNNSKECQRRMSSVSFMSASPFNDSGEELSTPRTVNTRQCLDFCLQLT